MANPPTVLAVTMKEQAETAEQFSGRVTPRRLLVERVCGKSGHFPVHFGPETSTGVFRAS
jgi:hypothetical protein